MWRFTLRFIIFSKRIFFFFGVFGRKRERCCFAFYSKNSESEQAFFITGSDPDHDTDNRKKFSSPTLSADGGRAQSTFHERLGCPR